MAVGADVMAGAFREYFHAEPEGVWHAPGRTNFIGEHTDYNDGWVLPFALDRGVSVAARRRGDGLLRIRSRQQLDAADLTLDSLTPGSVTGWAAYPAGVAWALREAGHAPGGADLAVDSDLPQGAGLSSSAALECAVGLALTGLYHIRVSRRELAALARRAENEMAGVPSGVMDQSASLLGQAGHALLLDCRTLETEAVPLDPGPAGLTLTVIDTRAPHALTDGRYALRRRECELAARHLGVERLRDVTDESLVSRLRDETLRRRARHVITENLRVLAAVDLLRSGDLAGTGELLLASHASLAADFAVSWPQADVTVEAARRAGAPGARMVGGGFGGSVLALLPADSGRARAAISAEFGRHGWPAPRFLPATPSPGARPLPWPV